MPNEIRALLAGLAMTAALLVAERPARAQEAASVSSSPVLHLDRQSMGDAWWTGPMLAPSAATLPQGHFLVEPYFYDVSTSGSNTFGSLSYILYGLRNKLTIGMIPTVDYEVVNGGLNSSTVELGDTSLLIQCGLTQFHEGSWHPMTAINVQQTFPTGRYDQLGNKPSDGFGGGAYTTAIALYSQTYLWLPNGRILRMRFNISDAFSSSVGVQGVSVYGTDAGFRGNAKPGQAAFADLAGEYSVTKKWVAALDVEYHFNGNTNVSGFDMLASAGSQSFSSVETNSGSIGQIIFAPAVEFNWKHNLGVLVGTRIIEVGHNITPSITPAIAINYVH